MNHLQLNFAPLKNQSPDFVIFRKEVIGDERKKDFNKHVRKLYSTIDKVSHWYSFYKLDAFEEIKFDNHNKAPWRIKKLWLEDQLFQLNQKLNEKSFLTTKFNFRLNFILENHIEGKEVVWIEPYFLKKENLIGFLINFRFFRSKITETQTNKELVLSLALTKDFKVNKYYHIDLYTKIRLFARLFYTEYFKNSPLDFTGLTKLEAPKLTAKHYLFQNNSTDTSQFNGLKMNGPYSPPKSNPTFIFCYKKGEERLIKELVDKLNGIGDSTFQGFESIFKSKFEHKFLNRSNLTPEETIDSIESISGNLDNFVAVFIEPTNKEKEAINFYFKIKFISLSKKIPVQFIQYKTIGRSYTISNFALQLFAKSSGIPWIVKPSNNNCLIVGLAQVVTGNANERFHGYSVLLDSSGLFKEMKVLSSESNKEEYLNQLSSNLINILKENNQYDKIVIHAPFKEKEESLYKISSKLKEEVDPNKEVVLIRINVKNKFFGFNVQSQSLIPQESSFLNISENEFLIWSEGIITDSSFAKKLYSGPTYIEFYYSSKELSFEEKKSYLQDIINLSGANWRGFNSKTEPVSVFYSHLVTKFISEFDDREWNIRDFSILNPWFL